MTKLWLALTGRLLLCLGLLTAVAGRGSPPAEPGQQMLAEQKHFMECLASVYSPAFWISYNDSLYFHLRNEAQAQQLESMKLARAKYVALTNREARYDLAARAIAASGVNESWQKQLLLPFSATNQNLTPTLDRPLLVVPSYKLLQSRPGGDALIQDGGSVYFVMNFGRGADDAACTNALLIREGVKTYAAGDRFRTVDAFANVSLSKEERAVLNRVAAAFQKRAAILGQELATFNDREAFEACKARATDSNPYMEYLLAMGYLEGKGTEKDERLGLDWMNRAAKSGSGDAQAYLQKLGRKTP